MKQRYQVRKSQFLGYDVEDEMGAIENPVVYDLQMMAAHAVAAELNRLHDEAESLRRGLYESEEARQLSARCAAAEMQRDGIRATMADVEAAAYERGRQHERHEAADTNTFTVAVKCDTTELDEALDTARDLTAELRAAAGWIRHLGALSRDEIASLAWHAGYDAAPGILFSTSSVWRCAADGRWVRSR